MLIGLLLLHAVTAIAGGLSIITGNIELPADTLAHSAFPDLYFPGVILMAIVGGSALIAALATWKRVLGSELAVIVACVVMFVWLTGEIASIRHINFLQVTYYSTTAWILYILKPSTPVKK